MSFLNTLLGNTGIKEKILKQFTDSFTERGVSKILIEILPDGKIDITELIDGEVVVKQVDYDFLKEFFHEKAINNG